MLILVVTVSRHPSQAPLPFPISNSMRTIPFLFIFFRTLCTSQKTYLFSFQSIPHSLDKTRGGGSSFKSPCLFNKFQTLWEQHCICIMVGQVCGDDFSFCEQSSGQGYRHFFYGGEPGVAERLAESLKARFPGLNVVGTYSPPFRPLTAAEDEEIEELIGRAAPDVLWVGLGTPKQERWMHAHKEKLHVPVLVGVGAAFDMLSGRKKQAPRWMREHGLEWLFRLMQEPRRLWRRYLVYGAQFIAYIALESLGLKKFDARGSSLQKGTRGHQART